MFCCRLCPWKNGCRDGKKRGKCRTKQSCDKARPGGPKFDYHRESCTKYTNQKQCSCKINNSGPHHGMLILTVAALHYAGSVCLPLILSFVCLTELEEFLLATKSQSVAAKERKHCKTAGSGSGRGAPKVRTLKAPFIKVEDMSRAYKPLVFQVKVWPTPNVHCSPEGSPFDSPPHGERARNGLRDKPLLPPNNLQSLLRRNLATASAAKPTSLT